MSIKPKIYDSLTHRQRIIATVEAMVRNDDSEHEKLVRSCPKKNYEGPDLQFSGNLHSLLFMSLAIEQELTSYAVYFFLSSRNGEIELAEKSMQRIIDTYAAWNQHLESMGIDPRAMDKIVKDTRNPYVDLLLQMGFCGLPRADEDAVKTRLANLGDFFKKALTLEK